MRGVRETVVIRVDCRLGQQKCYASPATERFTMAKAIIVSVISAVLSAIIAVFVVKQLGITLDSSVLGAIGGAVGGVAGACTALLLTRQGK